MLLSILILNRLSLSSQKYFLQYKVTKVCPVLRVNLRTQGGHKEKETNIRKHSIFSYKGGESNEQSRHLRELLLMCGVTACYHLYVSLSALLTLFSILCEA